MLGSSEYQCMKWYVHDYLPSDKELKKIYGTHNKYEPFINL